MTSFGSPLYWIKTEDFSNLTCLCCPGRSLHPYCAVTDEEWLSWNVGKRRASEVCDRVHYLPNKRVYTITRRQILDSSKLKEFADDNFKFDENGRKLSRGVGNTGKRRSCSLRTISPFPPVFSKGLFPRGVKRCHCVGMG